MFFKKKNKNCEFCEELNYQLHKQLNKRLTIKDHHLNLNDRDIVVRATGKDLIKDLIKEK